MINFLYLNNSKIIWKKDLDTKPCYSEQILSVPW